MSAEPGGGIVAVVSALPAELAGIRGLGGFIKARLGEKIYYKGDVRGADAALFVSGMGHEKAYSAAREICRALRPMAYISVGFSGALDPALKAGDVVIGSAVAPCEGPEAVYHCDVGLVEAARGALGAGAKEGLLLASKRVLVKAEEKRRFAPTLNPSPAGGEGKRYGRPVAVDMESLGAAMACAEAGVPFIAIRAISDAAGEDLPVDFNLFVRDSDMRWGAFALHVTTHPWVLPGLMRLGRNSRKAVGNLAKIIEKFLLRL